MIQHGCGERSRNERRDTRVKDQKERNRKLKKLETYTKDLLHISIEKWNIRSRRCRHDKGERDSMCTTSALSKRMHQTFFYINIPRKKKILALLI